jgi:hypothetical protein
MFVKEKRSGTTKARGCADGRKQRLCKTKQETRSPAVRTESLLLSCVIDAKEVRQVMTCDILGAFMQVDVDEVVHVRLSGALAALLEKVDPGLCSKHVTTENGKPALCVQPQKALCGTLSASLLFWKDLSQHLKEQGFAPNPHDSCVMNKMAKGKQSTILWHVDDLKTSHVDGRVNEDAIEKLKDRCGKETPVTVTRGTIHDCLGMTFDCGANGKVKIRMNDCAENPLGDVPDNMAGTAAGSGEPLQGGRHCKADIFHSVTARLLFLCE